MTISGIENFTVAQAFSTQSASEDRSIRPFKVQVPQAELEDLRRRINATRWPDKETVDERSQGTQLAKLQELVRYWGTDYDWRKVEAATVHHHDRRARLRECRSIGRWCRSTRVITYANEGPREPIPSSNRPAPTLPV